MEATIRRLIPTLESVWQDVRYGARSLWRAPLFTAVAVLSIGGGLAAGTAVFATMNAIFFRPIAVNDAGDVYRILTSNREGAKRVAYTVARRTNEMGIRLALGATPPSLVRLILRPAGVLIAVGAVLGALVGAAIAQVIQSQSSGLPPLNLAAGLPIALAFAVVALVAGAPRGACRSGALVTSGVNQRSDGQSGKHRREFL